MSREDFIVRAYDTTFDQHSQWRVPKCGQNIVEDRARHWEDFSALEDCENNIFSGFATYEKFQNVLAFGSCKLGSSSSLWKHISRCRSSADAPVENTSE